MDEDDSKHPAVVQSVQQRTSSKPTRQLVNAVLHEEGQASLEKRKRLGQTTIV